MRTKMEQSWNFSWGPFCHILPEQTWNKVGMRTIVEQSRSKQVWEGTKLEQMMTGLCVWFSWCTIWEQSGWNLAFQVCAGLEVRTDREQSVTEMEHYRNKLWMGTDWEQSWNRNGTYLEQTGNFCCDFVPDLHPIGAPPSSMLGNLHDAN